MADGGSNHRMSALGAGRLCCEKWDLRGRDGGEGPKSHLRVTTAAQSEQSSSCRDAQAGIYELPPALAHSWWTSQAAPFRHSPARPDSISHPLCFAELSFFHPSPHLSGEAILSLSMSSGPHSSQQLLAKLVTKSWQVPSKRDERWSISSRTEVNPHSAHICKISKSLMYAAALCDPFKCFCMELDGNLGFSLC